ncbi:Thiol-disulfide oxidoreductase ResA [bacterium HR33]|nr:Thiol-disulfide oxidoreductase ResA [bacterium HR33]
MTQRAQWLAVGAVVGLLALLLAAAVTFTGEVRAVGVGSEAPDFEAVNLKSGELESWSRYRGEVVLLNIWATWCLPCEQEMPSMERLYRELGPEGLRIIAVSVDVGPGEPVLEWTRERDLTFEIWHDPKGRIQRIYQTTGVPESFVIDRHGVIVKKVIGAAEWDHPAQKALFRRLLEEPAESGGR